MSNAKRDQSASDFLSTRLTKASNTIIAEPERKIQFGVDSPTINTSSATVTRIEITTNKRRIPIGVFNELDIHNSPR